MKQKACLLAVAAFAALAAVGTRADDLRERQTQACMGDALRLCGDAVPDEGRVSACMNAKRAELNPGCRVFFTDASATDDEVTPKASAKANRSKAQPVSVR
jgi:hypothetical protein